MSGVHQDAARPSDERYWTAVDQAAPHHPKLIGSYLNTSSVGAAGPVVGHFDGPWLLRKSLLTEPLKKSCARSIALEESLN